MKLKYTRWLDLYDTQKVRWYKMFSSSSVQNPLFEIPMSTVFEPVATKNNNNNNKTPHSLIVSCKSVVVCCLCVIN